MATEQQLRAERVKVPLMLRKEFQLGPNPQGKHPMFGQPADMIMCFGKFIQRSAEDVEQVTRGPFAEGTVSAGKGE